MLMKVSVPPSVKVTVPFSRLPGSKVTDRTPVRYRLSLSVPVVTVSPPST